MPDARHPLLRALLVAAAVAAIPALPPAAGATRPPVDLTGTVWHTEGLLRASARGRVTSGPTFLDLEFLPDRRFRAVDPAGTTLEGTYETAGAAETRLAGTCDPSSVASLEATLEADLALLLGETVLVDTLSHRVRARTNRDADRLAVRVKFRFQVFLPGMGRTLRLRESIRTAGVR
jgi:hypothetical protein